MRLFKKEILEILGDNDPRRRRSALMDLPYQKTLNVLFGTLCHTDAVIKERSITAMADIVSRKAEEDMDAARAVMRRLMWSLNEESGWIGWGSAEAMGEIMARNSTLAQEYHKILISYISEGENYLLFEELRKEVYRGLERLARACPELVEEVPLRGAG